MMASRATRLLVGALAAALLFAAPAAAGQPAPLDDGPDLIAFGGDPWAGIFDSAAFDIEDAFVFADVPPKPRLGEDAVAIAVRSDQDRLAEAASGDAPLSLALNETSARVASAFDRFVIVGSGAAAYASRAFARGDAVSIDVVDAVSETPARVALNVPGR